MLGKMQAGIRFLHVYYTKQQRCTMGGFIKLRADDIADQVRIVLRSTQLAKL